MQKYPNTAESFSVADLLVVFRECLNGQVCCEYYQGVAGSQDVAEIAVLRRYPSVAEIPQNFII